MAGDDAGNVEATESTLRRLELRDFVAGRNSWNRKQGAEATSRAVCTSASNDIVEGNREDGNQDDRKKLGAWGSVEGDEKFALQRLQAVANCSEKLSIPAMDLESNLQEQADEILALESIYGGDFMRFDNEQLKTPSFVIAVNVDIPESLTLVAELPSNVDPLVSVRVENPPPTDGSYIASTSCNSQLNRQLSFSVKWLPPIHVLFTLPPSYPSHTPPVFTLYALWLNSQKLSRICSSLDMISNDQQGQVVLYPWIDWLQNQCLSFLDGSEKLELGPYGGGGVICRNADSDPRAVTGCCSFDSDIAGVLQFNEERKTEEFCKSLHMCSICFTEHTGKEFAKMPCEHVFCWSCMKTFASVLVNEGSVDKLNCPDTTCRHSIPPFVLDQLLDKVAFARWESLVLQRSLDGMEDIVYCPRCETACIEEEDHFVQCGNCFFSFCSLCRQTLHVGQECVSPEARLLILQERQKGRNEGRQKEQDMINELMNMQYVRREAKQCPRCKIAISKTEGCNKMVCSNCGQYFCFKCGNAIHGYDHFGNASCQLFEEKDLQWQPPWQQPDMRLEQQRAQIELQLWPNLGRSCPNCGQLNVKTGNNNHIYCWSCKSSYCCLCKKVVRRTSEHYGSGPRKCRQHTVD